MPETFLCGGALAAPVVLTSGANFPRFPASSPLLSVRGTGTTTAVLDAGATATAGAATHVSLHTATPGLTGANEVAEMRTAATVQVLSDEGTGSAAATGDLITSVAHGLTPGRTLAFTSLVGGAGLTLGDLYTVATAPTLDTFTLTGVDITSDYSALAWQSADVQITATTDGPVATATVTATHYGCWNVTV